MPQKGRLAAAGFEKTSFIPSLASCFPEENWLDCKLSGFFDRQFPTEEKTLCDATSPEVNQLQKTSNSNLLQKEVSSRRSETRMKADALSHQT